MTTTWSIDQPRATARWRSAYWRSVEVVFSITWRSVDWRMYRYASRRRCSWVTLSCSPTTYATTRAGQGHSRQDVDDLARPGARGDRAGPLDRCCLASPPAPHPCHHAFGDKQPSSQASARHTCRQCLRPDLLVVLDKVFGLADRQSSFVLIDF